jgi:AcrR family transcriptional regulator
MKNGEDRRVIKTKRNLKRTMQEMMGEMPFEKITVKAICERAMTSRITFYNYYNDKYALLEELFHDMNLELERRFQELQKYNQADDPVISYQNLLDCFIELHRENENIFRENTKLDQHTSLLPPYFHFMVNNITMLIEKYFKQLKPNYPPEQLSVFIFLGMFGYIYLSKAGSEKDTSELYESAHNLLTDILKSDLFTAEKR